MHHTEDCGLYQQLQAVWLQHISATDAGESPFSDFRSFGTCGSHPFPEEEENIEMKSLVQLKVACLLFLSSLCASGCSAVLYIMLHMCELNVS